MVATVTSSVAATDQAQRDGRFWVHETHIDSLGVHYLFSYLAAVGTDVQAALAVRAAGIIPAAAAVEVANNLVITATFGSLAAPSEQYSTTAQNLAALNAFWPGATQLQAIMLGDYFGSLSDVVLQSVLSINETQVTALRTQFFTPYAAAAATVRAATTGGW